MISINNDPATFTATRKSHPNEIVCVMTDSPHPWLVYLPGSDATPTSVPNEGDQERARRLSQHSSPADSQPDGRPHISGEVLYEFSEMGEKLADRLRGYEPNDDGDGIVGGADQAGTEEPPESQTESVDESEDDGA